MALIYPTRAARPSHQDITFTFSLTSLAVGLDVDLDIK